MTFGTVLLLTDWPETGELKNGVEEWKVFDSWGLMSVLSEL